jgi:tripartite-type tricarboxylate transporter receptor subunit TctC
MSVTTASSPATASVSRLTNTRSDGNKITQPDFSYFAGKTITLDASGAVGGTNWTEFNGVESGLASYLHATVNIVDYPTGDSIPGQNAAAGAAPNGLTVGEVGPQGNLIDDITNTPNIDFSMQKIEMIGSPHAPESIWYAGPGSGITKITQVMKSKTTLSALDLSTGWSDVLTRVFFGIYGADVDVIPGYENTGDLVEGILRGDGQLMVTSLTAALSAAQGGQVKPLLQATAPGQGTPLYATMKKIPTITTYAASHKPTTPAGRAGMKELIAMAAAPFISFFVPGGTPEKYVVALTDAFRSVMAQQGPKNYLLSAGLPVGWISPKVSESDLKTETSHATILGRFVNYTR